MYDSVPLLEQSINIQLQILLPLDRLKHVKKNEETIQKKVCKCNVQQENEVFSKRVGFSYSCHQEQCETTIYDVTTGKKKSFIQKLWFRI